MSFIAKTYDYGKNWSSLAEQCKLKAHYCCERCGKSFINNKIALHAHHRIPLSKGGRNVLSNLIAVCEECHSKIHGKTINTSRFKRDVRKSKFYKEYY